MTTRILFVCLGNICRSPTAEGVFRRLAAQAGADVVVDSAGTSGWHDGELPDRRSMAEARRRGYDFSDQRSRQVRATDFHEFDLIIAMDRANLARLRSMAPRNADATLKLLLDYLPGQPLREVPDPYYSDGFGFVFDLIEDASRAILAEL